MMFLTKTATIVTDISKLSPTHFVSNIRHQHRCSLKSRMRHRTSLKLNDEFPDRLKIDWRWRHSISESFYVGFRHWFHKIKWFWFELPLIRNSSFSISSRSAWKLFCWKWSFPVQNAPGSSRTRSDVQIIDLGLF